jgi:transposase
MGTDRTVASARAPTRRSAAGLREVVNAILYITKNGCTWRDLPGDLPHHKTVYAYFRKWSTDGTLEGIYQALHRRWRQRRGHRAYSQRRDPR